MTLLLPRRQLVLAALAAPLLPACANAPTQDPRITAIADAAFRPLMATHDIPGMVVGVTVGGRSTFVEYGVASRETGARATRDTLFEIGSLSKTFTATLACLARAQGKLQLADTPGHWLPPLRGSALDRATLLHLGTYTAGGLPLQFPDTITTVAQAYDWYRQWTPTAAPGVQRRYSNPSIGLLGHVTALAMQDEFATLMQRELFKPLGLNHTHIHVPDAAKSAYAWGYNRANQPIRVNPGVFDAEAYGIKASAADLLRFVQANLQPPGLPPALRQAITDTHTGHFAVHGMVQGLGWEQYPWPVALERLQAGNASEMALQPQPAAALVPPRKPSGPTLFNKTGSTNGFGGYAAFVPERGVGVVMLANRNIPIPSRIEAAHAVLTQLDVSKAGP